jgi:hypothetical protein
MGTAFAIPSLGTWYAPRITDASSSGIFSAASDGEISSPSTPYDRANPRRRFSSFTRSGVVATSIPPTPCQHGSPRCSDP